MDEFGAYALSNMDQPFEMGRTSGLSLWALFQSYGQLDKVSPEFKQIVNATTYTKIFLAWAIPWARRKLQTSLGKRRW